MFALVSDELAESAQPQKRFAMKAQKTLLLVDDGHQLKNCIAALENSGYAVLTARGARQGLKLFVSSPVDAVVLDCATRGNKRHLVAARMRKRNPRIPILMTGRALPESALNLADGFIDKRNRPEFFPMAVDRLLRRDRRLSVA
jgi:DNA-binding NtrC family response regulator